MKSYKYNLFMCLIEMRNCRKTVDTYDILAKYVPPGSFEAMKTYIGLPGKKTTLFLEPTSSESQYVSVAQHLKRFGKIFLKSEDPPNCNLIRKQFHTVLLRKSREGEAMKLMSKVDAHSAQIAMAVYATTTAADDAKLGKYLYEELFGNPVEWPSSDMLSLEESIDLSQDMTQLVPFDGSDDDFYNWQGEEDHDEEEDFILTAEDVGEEPHHGKDGSGGKKREVTALQGDVRQSSKRIKDNGHGVGDHAKVRRKRSAANIAIAAPAHNECSASNNSNSPRSADRKEKQVPGKRSAFTKEQKSWISDQVDRWIGNPHADEARAITKQGIDSGIFDGSKDVEQVRHVLRTSIGLGGGRFQQCRSNLQFFFCQGSGFLLGFDCRRITPLVNAEGEQPPIQMGKR